MNNVVTTKWENEDIIVRGDTASIFGTMRLQLANSGEETEDFVFGLRVKVRNNQIVLWNWLEDSFAVSQAYHGSGRSQSFALVQTFYDLLSNPSSASHVAAFEAATSDDWESIGDYSGESEPKAAFMGQMGFFAQLMPDLNWDVQAMYDAGDFITVRSRATATPVGPLFGVDGQGRSFDMMTIDVHQIEDGKIVRTYHVEDWSTALLQLSGN